MDLIRMAGLSPAELLERVNAERWRSWCSTEPVLASLGSLADLRGLRGSAEDQPLGALLRLAAVDGGGDDMAAVAIVHQMEQTIDSLSKAFAHLAQGEIDGIAVGALWQVIRTFPWRRRRRAFGACLHYSTRREVVRLLLPDHASGLIEPVLYLQPEELDLLEPEPVTTGGCSDPREELHELLAWAREQRVLDPSQESLLLELLAIDIKCAEVEPLRGFGACSNTAVTVAAVRAGVCTKTVRRARNRAIDRLRSVMNQYTEYTEAVAGWGTATSPRLAH